MDGRFTDEELAIAKSVDLCAVAESLGYTVKRIGKYHTLILSILVYTFFTRMFDFMLPLVVKYSIVAA